MREEQCRDGLVISGVVGDDGLLGIGFVEREGEGELFGYAAFGNEVGSLDCLSLPSCCSVRFGCFLEVLCCECRL